MVEWAVCKLQQLIYIWVANKLARNSAFLSVGEEQVLPGCNGISISGRLPGSWKSCPQLLQTAAWNLHCVLSLEGAREQLSCCSSSWHGQGWEQPSIFNCTRGWEVHQRPKDSIFIGKGKSCIRICALLILNSSTFVAVCAEWKLLETSRKKKWIIQNCLKFIFIIWAASISWEICLQSMFALCLPGILFLYWLLGLIMLNKYVKLFTLCRTVAVDIDSPKPRGLVPDGG